MQYVQYLVYYLGHFGSSGTAQNHLGAHGFFCILWPGSTNDRMEKVDSASAGSAIFNEKTLFWVKRRGCRVPQSPSRRFGFPIRFKGCWQEIVCRLLIEAAETFRRSFARTHAGYSATRSALATLVRSSPVSLSTIQERTSKTSWAMVQTLYIKPRNT